MTENRALLENIPGHLSGYRIAIDHLLLACPHPTEHLRHRFLETLIAASQLYLDYSLVMKALPGLNAASSDRKFNQIHSDLGREGNLRKKLRAAIESSLSSAGFEPQNVWSAELGLVTTQDYIDSFSLHLPEIYEETFRAEVCIDEYLVTGSGSALAQLAIGFEHLARNHISFVLQPLQWAADENSWRLPSSARPLGQQRSK